MILTLFGFLIGLCLVILSIGLFRPDESIFALIGFGLFFLLSLIIIAGNVEYETGSNLNASYTYSNATLTAHTETVAYTYESWNDATSKQVGYWLAILSAFGFIFMLFRTRGERL